MEANNINWLMVNTKRGNLAEAMEFSAVDLGDNAISFFDKFKRSGWMSRFENNDGRATLGCSGSELVLMIHDKLGQKYQSSDFRGRNPQSITASVEHWIGYALGYIQGRANCPFKEIFKKFPLDDWYKMHILHEVGDDVLWDKTMGRYLPK